DTLAADINVAGAFDQRADVAVALAAERAVGVLLRPARAAAAGGRAAATLAAAPRGAAREVLTRWHTRSFLEGQADRLGRRPGGSVEDSTRLRRGRSGSEMGAGSANRRGGAATAIARLPGPSLPSGCRIAATLDRS